MISSQFIHSYSVNSVNKKWKIKPQEKKKTKKEEIHLMRISVYPYKQAPWWWAIKCPINVYLKLKIKS